MGLGVRVPFCDHRLVEYVFNAPWSLKTFDGREKSLLRHATKDTMPQSVVDRVKSPYPSTQDPGYAAELQKQSADVLKEDGPAVSLLNKESLNRALKLDPSDVDTQTRAGFERLLDLSAWFDIHNPTIRV